MPPRIIPIDELRRAFRSRRLTLSSLLLIGSNLIPLIGVAFFGWSVYITILLFWMENVVVGATNVLRMLIALGPKGIPLALFFTVHFGGFTLGHGFFVMMMFGRREVESDPFSIVRSIPDLLNPATSPGGSTLLLAFAAIAVSHVVSLLVNFVGGGEYRRTNAGELMFRPYKRIIVLHVTIMFGGFLAMFLRSAAPAVALLVLLKIAVDLRAHLKEHAGEAGPDEPDEALREGTKRWPTM